MSNVDLSIGLTKQEVQNYLRSGTYRVKFTKLDGDEREMVCTLQEDFLPKTVRDENKPERKQSLDSVSVIDVEKNEWRSFRLDSILEFQELK